LAAQQVALKRIALKAHVFTYTSIDGAADYFAYFKAGAAQNSSCCIVDFLFREVPDRFALPLGPIL
jgi:hypothetical protein